MNSGGLFWLIIGAGSMLLFFGIAAVVTLLGAGDLRELLRGTQRRNGNED